MDAGDGIAQGDEVGVPLDISPHDASKYETCDKQSRGNNLGDIILSRKYSNSLVVSLVYILDVVHHHGPIDMC